MDSGTPQASARPQQPRVGVGDAAQGQRRRVRRSRRVAWATVALLLPATVLLAAFLVASIILAVWVGATNQTLTGAQAVHFEFVGLANFGRLFSDPDFIHSIVISAEYVVAAVVGITGVGLLLAYLMRRGVSRWLIATVSSIVIIAWVIPEIVAGFIWFAFAGNGGTLAAMLAPLSPGTGDWLIRAPLVLVTIATIWAGTAFAMLVFSAGLQNLPDEVIEAAVVDGANLPQRIVRVELPMMKRTIATTLILVTLSILTDFTLIYALTAGGPGDATMTMPLYVFQEAISFTQLGYGTAAAVVLVAIAAVVSILYVKLLKIEV